MLIKAIKAQSYLFDYKPSIGHAIIKVMLTILIRIVDCHFCGLNIIIDFIYLTKFSVVLFLVI